MAVTLESLELGPNEFAAAKEAVEKMAYFNWNDAGCPDGRQDEFWLKAQRDWISCFYVPQRTPDNTGPGIGVTEANRVTRQLPAVKARRRGRAAADVA